MVTVEVVAGRAVLVRRGGDELRREAQVLRALAGPGVPEVVEVGDDDGIEVRLVTAVEPPLVLAGADVGSVVAQVAAVLARAHDAGIVHGPLRDEHLVGRPGAVVVGGWHDAGPGDPAADVVELGRLVQRHAGADPVLLALADRALAPEPPSMSALAAPPSLPVPPRAQRRPSLPVVGLAVAAVVVVTGLAVGGGAAAPAPAAAPPSTTTSSEVPTTTTTTSAPVIDARVTGNVVEREGQRWTVGQAGDVVVLGDWRCDGDPSPAVLRPASGQVWVFDGWSPDGAPVAGRTLAAVPGAVDLRVEHAGRCDRLVVIDAQGATTAVG